MEKETKMSSEVHVVKGAPENVKTVDVSVKDVKGEISKEDKVMKKEEEDTTFDGVFIKVEKEGTDTKDGEKAEKQVPIERSSQREELYELQEKVKALELELEKNKAVMGEKKALEDTLNGYNVKLTESENLLRVLRSELEVAEERLEKQAREIDEANKRSTEMKDLHKHSDLSIQKAMKELNIIDTEAKSLTEKSKHLKGRIRLYEDKLAEASAHSFSLKHDLDQSSLEIELLSDTNNQLKIKIQELEGFLCAERERFNQRDIEAKDLVEKLQSHENLIEEHKRKVLEVSEVADTRQMELEKALLKLKTFEDTIKELEKENGSLTEVNLKLNQELANHGSETFQAVFSALEAEKDQTAKEAVSQKHSELEATLKKSQEELEAKKSMIVHLESLLKDLEKSKEIETMGKGEVEVKSRDIDFSFSTPKQRKSKKEADASASASHSSSSGNVTTQKAETSNLMTLKIVLGVALMSLIIGIILGKKY